MIIGVSGTTAQELSSARIQALLTTTYLVLTSLVLDKHVVVVIVLFDDKCSDKLALVKLDDDEAAPHMSTGSCPPSIQSRYSKSRQAGDEDDKDDAIYPVTLGSR